MKDIELTHLYIYPIKSMAAIAVDSMQFDQFGAKFDRRWMLIDQNNKMLTARTHPQLCLFKPSLTHEKIRVTYQERAIEFDIFTSAEILSATIWSDQVRCHEVCTTVSNWFSQQLQQSVRLVAMAEDFTRPVDSRFTSSFAQVAMADGFPLLLCNTQSERALYSQASMLRFRPNLVVNASTAFIEDHWRRISIGNCIFDIVKPCARCCMPAVNPEDATKQPVILKKLADNRLFSGQIYFGQNVLLGSDYKKSTLQVGQLVRVEDSSKHSNIMELANLLAQQ